MGFLECEVMKSEILNIQIRNGLAFQKISDYPSNQFNLCSIAICTLPSFANPLISNSINSILIAKQNAQP